MPDTTGCFMSMVAESALHWLLTSWITTGREAQVMKLTITHTLATAFAMAGCAVAGVPGVAHADPPPLNGTYTGDGGADEFLWTISTNCATNGCTGNVASNQGWSVPATLTNGIWNFTVTKPDGAICDDGSFAPAYISLAIDPNTLNGAISADSNYGCPGGQISQTPFKLKKVS